MAKSSINPDSDEGSQIVPANTGAEVVQHDHYDADQYDDQSRDIETPILGLVNKIGPLSKTFPKNAGEFVLSDELLGESVQVIPMGILKFYIETYRDGKEIKFGSGIMSKTFPTANAAAAAGYYVDFDNVEKNRIEEASKVGFLIIAPDDFDDTVGQFYLDLPSGKRATIGRCTYRRGGHRSVYRPVFNYAVGRLRAAGEKLAATPHETFAKAEAFDCLWTLSAEHVENTARQQDWYEPRIKRSAKLSDEDVAWIKEQYESFSI